jgi:DNA-binding PadR family transcriptional regulator
MKGGSPMAPKRDPDALLPLTPALFHVLVALADGDKHGYAILRDVEQRTERRVLLSTGTLYGIIKRLLADGLIAEARRRPAASMDDERRRYYRLTAFGREVALAETARLERASAMARATRGLRLARDKA